MLKSVQTTLLSLSETNNDIEQAKSEWGLFGDIEGGEFANNKWICEACGQKPLKYRGLIANSQNGNLLWVGQECALYFGVLKEGLKFPQYWKRQILNRSIDELIDKPNPTIVQLNGLWLSKSAHDFALRNLALGKKFAPVEVLYLVQRFEEEGILYDDAALAFWARSTIPQIKSGTCGTLKMSDWDFDKIAKFYSAEMIKAREAVRTEEREAAQAIKELEASRALAEQKAKEQEQEREAIRKAEKTKPAYLEAQKYTPASNEEKQRLALIREAERAQMQKKMQDAQALAEQQAAEQAAERAKAQEREFLEQKQRADEFWAQLKAKREQEQAKEAERIALSQKKTTQEEREQRLLLGITENQQAIDAEKRRIKERQEKAEREMKAWREAQEKNKGL